MGRRKNADSLIPRVSMPKTDTEYTNISKIAHYITTTSGLVDAGKLFTLVTMPSKNATVTIALNADKGIKLSKNITQYDFDIMDAVYSLYINGCSVFSPEMVARMISGKLDGRVSAQKIGSVTRSINKLRHVDITIDLTDEYIKSGRELPEDRTLLNRTSYLLPLDVYSAVIPDNGKVLKNRKAMVDDEEIEIIAGYEFIKKPVLYTYAEQHGDIENFPMALLSDPSISDTDENTAIKWYIVRRIAALRKAKNKTKELQDIIYYDEEERQGAFADLWYNPDEYSNWRKKKAKIHEAIVAELEICVREKFIKSYEVLKDGVSIEGVSITVESEF